MQARICILLIFCLQLQAGFAQPAEKLLLTTSKQYYYPGEQVWFVVNSFDACRNKLAQLSGIGYMELVDVNAQPLYRLKLSLENAQAKGTFLIDDNFPSGTYTLIAYTSWMKNFGPKTYVRKPINIINPTKPAKLTSYELPDEMHGTVSIQTGKKTYAKRDAVTLSCSVGKPARFSVSVYKTNELEKGSEALFISSAGDSCNTGTSGKLPFVFERRGHIVSGKVIHAESKLPAPGVTVYLSVIPYPDRLFTATSDSTGDIRFDIGELTGATEFVLQPEPAIKNRYIVEINDPFADRAPGLLKEGDVEVFASQPQAIDESLISAQVQNIFTSNATPPTDHTNTKPFYGKPDGFYIVGNYKHFTTVEEILREYVANVGVQKRGGKLYPVVFDLKTLKRFTGQPLILVNGVPVFDGDRFMKMNTDEFYSIAVVAGRFFMGSRTFYGIIDVRLNNSLKEFGANTSVIDYDCLQPKTEFVSPEYDNETKRLDRKPDFRNVLYWNPLVETDNAGEAFVKFYTSDLEGEYVIIVKAIGKDGQLSMGKTSITVK